VTLVEQLLDLGRAMTSRYAALEKAALDEQGQPTGETITVQTFIGWTTDEAKAEAARDAGATLRPYKSFSPECSGWDVSVTEVVDGPTRVEAWS
jgi:hypothetical protein